MSQQPFSADTAPRMDEWQGYLATALSIVTEAADVLVAAFGRHSATRKSDGTLVTAADRAVDELVTARLYTSYPDHTVLSEERDTRYVPDTPFTWVVDPLDGTTNFARGLAIWGISLALLYRGAPVVGVLSFPLLHETFMAVRGRGAQRNGASTQTSSLVTPDDEHFLMCCTRTPRRYRLDTPLKPRILGSAAYHVAAVACGSAAAGVEATPKLWDLAAALLILEEAGGAYRLLSGGGTLFPLAESPTNYANLAFPLLVAAGEPLLARILPTITPVAPRHHQ
jgi:myo-inositol-1(or 4)-monophosphatase